MKLSGPSQCVVGPSLKSEEAWHIVATCAITPARDLLGQVASFVDPPPWSLNAPHAKLRRFHSEGNPLQNGLLHHTQSIGIPPAGSGSWLESFWHLTPQSDQTQEVLHLKPLDQAGTALHLQGWQPSPRVWDISYTYLCKPQRDQTHSYVTMKAYTPPSS